MPHAASSKQQLRKLFMPTYCNYCARLFEGYAAY
jgi:hypothetical protein